MNNMPTDCKISSVFIEAMEQTYLNFPLPSEEQIRTSMKKMMDQLETDHGWRSGNEG
ncbi:hypothetical protein [Paenibacillus sp. N3.4]|uniref:hypothetical protein n=1 Tax=Paenibacillus sp. N3.4 TaxID=2603222 RepID=UPI00164F264F|nr:hypothetical protein [Paenibacillus sp. N3.4]